MCRSTLPLSNKRVLGFLATLARVRNAPGVCRLKVLIAQFADCRGGALHLLFAGGILAAGDIAEQAFRFLTSLVRWRQRTVLADRVPPLAIVGGAVLQDVGYRGSALPAGAKASETLIPNNGAGLESPYLAKADCLPLLHGEPV